MIIALATDDLSLIVFGSIESAVAYCEGIDVEDGGWSFWDECGVPMRPVFSEPNERDSRCVRNGSYQLEPASQLQQAPLAEALRGNVHLQPNSHFPSVASLLAHFDQVSPVMQHGT